MLKRHGSVDIYGNDTKVYMVFGLTADKDLDILFPEVSANDWFELFKHPTTNHDLVTGNVLIFNRMVWNALIGN